MSFLTELLALTEPKCSVKSYRCTLANNLPLSGKNEFCVLH